MELVILTEDTAPKLPETIECIKDSFSYCDVTYWFSVVEF